MTVAVDISGRRVGRLLVLSRAENKKGRTAWNCLCDCGVRTVVITNQLTDSTARRKSCGCARRSSPYAGEAGEATAIETLKRMLRYDADTGQFWWTASAPKKVANKKAGCKGNFGYFYIKVQGKGYRASRLAWLFVHGQMPNGFIDHINGNPSDNRICNLREADGVLNMQNMRRPMVTNKSGYLGVLKTAWGRWQSYIRADGEKKYLGTFDTPEEAHDAYIRAKRVFHKGCTI